MNQYLIKLVFDVSVDRTHQHFDEQWRVFMSLTRREALRAAVDTGSDESVSFVSEGGVCCEWRFVHVADCVELAGRSAGELVISLSKFDDDVAGYRSFVLKRGEEIMSEKKPTFERTLNS